MAAMSIKAEKLLARQLEEKNVKLMRKIRDQTEVIHNQELVSRVQK